jgi:MtN3 and saliva related transmembrane protein|tara:strand:+ start:549 stop:809 length:261 start_codon:yes stop_codon:yes gene_type:complete
MLNNFSQNIGLLAAIFTTIAFVPQVLKIYKTKSVEDISLPMWIIFSFGVFLWFIYGILIMSLPVILANIVTLMLSLFILFFKIKYG